MKYSNAQIIKTRSDFFPQIRLVKVNGRFYTVFGRLFAVKGNYFCCDEEQYKALCTGTTYSFTDWATLSGIYKTE